MTATTRWATATERRATSIVSSARGKLPASAEADAARLLPPCRAEPDARWPGSGSGDTNEGAPPVQPTLASVVRSRQRALPRIS